MSFSRFPHVRSLTFALCTAILALTPITGRAQTVSASCLGDRPGAPGACGTLRFTLGASADAPWLLQSFRARLGAGWSFVADVGDPAGTTFRGEDAFSFGIAFVGRAARVSPDIAAIDFFDSLGFTYALDPGVEGHLDFRVAGTGPLDAAYTVGDLDGVVLNGAAPVVTTPEPATIALLGVGLFGVAALARRAARPESV